MRNDIDLSIGSYSGRVRSHTSKEVTTLESLISTAINHALSVVGPIDGVYFRYRAAGECDQSDPLGQAFYISWKYESWCSDNQKESLLSIGYSKCADGDYQKRCNLEHDTEIIIATQWDKVVQQALE